MPTLDLTNRKSLAELNSIPKPTNENLEKLFLGVVRVIIKDGGVYKNAAMTDNIVLTISQLDKIQTFQKLLEINEENNGFYCLCSGDYAIELHTENEIKATIGFHHGISIRYNNWNCDAELAKSDQLLNFIAEQGLVKPLQNRIEAKRNMEADKIIERKWLASSPKCFSKYWTEIKNLNNNYFISLVTDLNREIPDKENQIIILLQTFGRTENFWSGYPIYEELPNEILKTFEVQEIILAYLNSNKNYKTRKGLGRFLCSFEFKKEREKYLKDIPQNVIYDLQKCFNQLNEQRGIDEITSLYLEKNNS